MKSDTTSNKKNDLSSLYRGTPSMDKSAIGNVNQIFPSNSSMERNQPTQAGTADSENSSNNSNVPLDSQYYQGNNGTSSQGSSYDDELAKLAREGNYKAYYSKVIQNANLNRLANKYLENSLKSQGIATQGAGTIAGTSLSNAYLNANAGAQSDFYDTEKSITEEAYNRRENENSSKLNEWSQLLSVASQNGNLDETYQQILNSNPNLDDATRNQLAQYYSAYNGNTAESSSKVSTYQQYMNTAAQSGNLSDWYEQNVTNNSELSDKEKAELAKYYSALNGTGNNFLSQVGINPDYSRYSTSDELKSIQLGNGRTGADVGDEVDTMTDYVTSNKPNQETVFHLVSQRNGVDMYIYYDPATNGYYRLSSEQAGKFTGKTYTVDKTTISDGDNGKNAGGDKKTPASDGKSATEMSSEWAEYYNFPDPNNGGSKTHSFMGYYWNWDGSKWVRGNRAPR